MRVGVGRFPHQPTLSPAKKYRSLFHISPHAGNAMSTTQKDEKKNFVTCILENYFYIRGGYNAADRATLD